MAGVHYDYETMEALKQAYKQKFPGDRGSLEQFPNNEEQMWCALLSPVGGVCQRCKYEPAVESYRRVGYSRPGRGWGEKCIAEKAAKDAAEKAAQQAAVAAAKTRAQAAEDRLKSMENRIARLEAMNELYVM